MGRTEKIFSWFFRLCKRTLKKTSFIVILCTLPLMAIGVNRMAKADGGILHIAVVVGSAADDVAVALTDSLFQQKSIIQYEQVNSDEEALKLVEAGEADAAWLIPDNLQQKIEEYVGDGMDKDDYLLTVVEREDNVALHLTREILFGKLYEPLAYEIYRQYVQRELLPEAEITEEELKDAYYRFDVEKNFFRFSYLDGETQNLEEGYLLLPMRGLLMLFVLLCGLAFTMYYMKEEEQGCFVWTKMSSGVLPCWCYHIPEMVLVDLMVLPALYFTGILENVGKEIYLLVIYSIMVIGFADVLRRICRKISIMGVMLPIIILLSMIVSPIFLKVGGLEFVKAVLPITYYFNALHETGGVLTMLLFIVIAYMLDCMLLWKSRNVCLTYKREKKGI